LAAKFWRKVAWFHSTLELITRKNWFQTFVFFTCSLCRYCSDKLYRRHPTGRPGSMKIETFRALQGRIPERIVEKAVRGMLPKNRMGRELFTQLKVYEVGRCALTPPDPYKPVAERRAWFQP
jgi:hypothetical protein